MATLIASRIGRWILALFLVGVALPALAKNEFCNTDADCPPAWSYCDVPFNRCISCCDFLTIVTCPNPACTWIANECRNDDGLGCATVAVCGNGTLESGEQCDDSNLINGDGCSETCQSESSNPAPELPPGAAQALLVAGTFGAAWLRQRGWLRK